MKKYLLLCFLLLEVSLNAQSFNMSFDSYSRQDTLNSEVVFTGHITNISNIDLSVFIVRKINDLPENWYSSFCFDNCFPPFLDSIATTADFVSTPITPNETREFSIHVSPTITMGTGHIKVLVGNLRNLIDTMSFDFYVTSILTGLKDERIVSNFDLLQNYPNPFNPNTIISFNLEKQSFVNLSIYNITGQKICTIINKSLNSGNYNYNFNAEGLSSGIYIYRLNTNGKTISKKMVLEK